MDTERTVSIVAPAGGRKNYVSLNMPIRKLANYSQLAKYRYFPGEDIKSTFSESNKRRAHTRDEFSLGNEINEECARTITTFIKNSDVTTPAPITLDTFGTERSLNELLQIWRVIGQGFKFPRDMHDESIRDDLRIKLYATTPFEFAHFMPILKTVGFDRGLIHSAMDRAAFLHIKGYLAEKDKVEIEEYCKAHEGQWDSLLETVGRVQVKIEDAAAEKEARDAARQKTREGRERKARAVEAAKGNPVKNGGNGGNKGGNSGNSGNKGGNGKGKAKKVQRFQRNDEDFPPLS
jgi:hypothetical protein